MSKKFYLLLALALAASAFALWRMGKASAPIVTPQPEPAEVSEAFDPVPSFEEMVQIEMSDAQSVETELYISEKNKFSVRIPVGTKVNESEEGDHTLTYFDLKDSVHTITIASHRGDVNATNLQEVIVSGKEGYLLTGGFKSENKVQCSDKTAICFLSKLYSQPTTEYPTPRLMRLVENVISQNEFPRFYNFDMGAYHPPLNDKDLSFFKQFHDSFRLLR